MSNTTSPQYVGPPIDITLTHAQKEVLITIRIVMAFLSLFGSLFVLGCMVKYRKFYGPRLLIMILTICNLGDAFSSLLSFGTFSHELDRPALCYMQGLSMQFFQVAAFCWSAVISVNLWLVIVRRRLDVDKLHSKYHMVVWTVVAVCVIMPNFTSAYGPASVWCWISKQARGGNVLRFLSFFVPFYISWLIIIVAYIWTYRVASSAFKHMRDEDREKSERQIQRLKAFPVIFVVLYIPATINRVYNWASQDDIFVLYLLQVLTAPAVGFINSIAYGMTDLEIRNRIANWFIRRGWCSYCLGDVPLKDNWSDEQHSSHSGGHRRSGSQHFDEENIVEGVLDDRGALSFSSRPTMPDEPVELEETQYFSNSQQKRKISFPDEEDTVSVDF